MYDSWTCLLVQNGPGLLAESVRTALKDAACDLYHKKWDRMKMTNNDHCTGVIETDWKSYTLGARSGFLFKARITEESGDYLVNFLYHSRDLKRGAELLEKREQENVRWIANEETVPLPELYDFSNPPAQYN
jgi:hypothetical protein